MSIQHHLVAAIGIAAVTLACGAQPAPLDVQTADATTPSTAPAAMPAAAGSTDALPAGHPPLDGSGMAGDMGAAPSGAAGTTPGAMPPGHPPLDGAGQAPGAMPGMPPNHPPMPSPGGTFTVPPPPGGTGEGAAALAWQTPAGWESVKPSSDLRRAQYRVPGPSGEAECAVFYFGPGQGGDPLANAQRWASQFVDAAGAPTTGVMKTRTATYGATRVLFVETEGTYLAGSMMGSNQIERKANFALLGAIAEGPDANWFFKLTGPKATVEAARGGFESMIASLKRGG